MPMADTPTRVVPLDDYRLRLAEELEQQGDQKLADAVRLCAQHNEACNLCEMMAGIDDPGLPDHG